MRWSGVLGMAQTPAIETTPGVYEDPIVEVKYSGEIVRESRGATGGNSEKNKTPFLRMAISVIPDKKLMASIASVRYATYMGLKWTVTSFEVQGIKYILNLGDNYDH